MWEKKVILPENAGKNHLDHLILLLLTIIRDTGDARHTLQGAIASPRQPIDRIMPPKQAKMTTKYPRTLSILVYIAIFHQKTIHHQ